MLLRATTTGTHVACAPLFAYARPTRCPVLTLSMVLPGASVLPPTTLRNHRGSRLPGRVPYAIGFAYPGTETAYRAILGCYPRRCVSDPAGGIWGRPRMFRLPPQLLSSFLRLCLP
eukprot:2095423-Rhodomonas_salina.1